VPQRRRNSDINMQIQTQDILVIQVKMEQYTIKQIRSNACSHASLVYESGRGLAARAYLKRRESEHGRLERGAMRREHVHEPG
jgi:hypothetical protein